MAASRFQSTPPRLRAPSRARAAFRLLLALAATAPLAACGAAGTGAGGGARPASVGSRPAPPPLFRAPPAGDAILGQTAAAVRALLGAPRLDLREGAGRKLQFSGGGCVVDVYFYAPAPQREPVATHVDARAADGRDADRAACVSAMRQR